MLESRVETVGQALRPRRRHGQLDDGLIVGMNGLLPDVTENLVRGPSIVFDQGGVDELHLGLRIGHPDRRGGRVRHQLEAGVALGQGRLGRALSGDVCVRAEPANDAPGLVAHGHGAGQKPAPFAVGAPQRKDILPRLTAFDRLLEPVGYPLHHRRVVHGLPAPACHLLGGRARVVMPTLVVPVDRAVRLSHPGKVGDVVGDEAIPGLFLIVPDVVRRCARRKREHTAQPRHGGAYAEYPKEIPQRAHRSPLARTRSR